MEGVDDASAISGQLCVMYGQVEAVRLPAWLPRCKLHLRCWFAGIFDQEGRYLGSEAHVLAHRLAHAHGTFALVGFLPGSSHSGQAAV